MGNNTTISYEKLKGETEMKRFRKFFIPFFLLTTIFFVGTAAAVMVPDDDGKLYWWEPPQQETYFISSESKCTQDEWFGQCVAYVRDYFEGSREKMPGLCNPEKTDCGAYKAWDLWNLDYGKGADPKATSIMVIDRVPLLDGHVAVIISVSNNFDGTYNLTAHESNWDDDEKMDCNVTYIFDSQTNTVKRNGGATEYPIRGFIYGATQNKDAEVLFLMDTSASMNDEFVTLCSKIGDIVQGLQNSGINVEYKILGITNMRNCTTDTVFNIVSNPTVNHLEDWGPAVEDVANQYNWKSGYARIAIPMSDEGAENGNTWTSADDDAIDRAKEAAKANNVGVIPVVCSGYNQQILDGATELANYCWGEVFISTTPTVDLVNGIINAINQLFNPVSDKVSVQLHIDDAYLDAGSKGYVNKIPGDIAFLVARITNGGDQAFTGDLKITFPGNWSLVGHGSVMKRKEDKPWEEEACTEQVNTSIQGEVLIQNISIDNDNISTANENEGKTQQYVVKVIIPKNENPHVSMQVKAEVYPSGDGSSFSSAEDTFMVSMTNKGDIILTNRHLLFERHSDKETVPDILKEIQKIALNRSAVVFYVDWWDEYDDFSGINPGGIGSDEASIPIKSWDRNNLQYGKQGSETDEQVETRLNNVSDAIDNYTHYWAGQLGGKENDHYLLIVGGDKIIPFYRFRDPWGSITSHTDKRYYGVTKHFESAAKYSYAFSDTKYADTDGNGWGDGKVDTMYVGRAVAHNADNLCLFLQNIYEDMIKNPQKDNVIVSSIEEFNGGFLELNFIDNIPGMFKDVNYTVFDSIDEKSLTDDYWNFSDIEKALVHGMDYFCYGGHGNNKGGYKFKGKDITGGIFKPDYPHLAMFACLMGLADWDDSAEDSNEDIFIYSAVSNNASSILASTTVQQAGYLNSFIDDYIQKTTGKNTFWSNEKPESVGKALNYAKRHVQGIHKGEFDSSFNVSQFGFLLYGAPWELILPPSRRNIATLSFMDSKTVRNKLSTQITTANNILTKTIQESISSYQINKEGGFDFVNIDGYKKLEFGIQTVPVLPVKRLEIVFPNDTIVSDISVTRSTPEALGTLNIPVFNDFPPVADEPSPDIYVSAPDNMEVFNTTHFEFETKEGKYKTIVLDIIPVEYDAVTNEAILYKNIDIQISYETLYNGVLLYARGDKVNYSSGETISVDIAIENISDQQIQFDANVELKDRFNNTVQTKTTSIAVDPANIGQTTVQLQAPQGGGYWIETSVSDGVQQIGTSSEHINVNSGDITDIDIPRCVPGGTSEISVTYYNSSDSQNSVSLALLIYNGSTQQANFIPIVYDVPADTSQTTTFIWKIPSDFPGGNYIAVATATVGDYVSSDSQTFGIGGLGVGWNLISLNQQPADTSIDSVLAPIADRYDSVWAYENGIWVLYDPDNPGFSDLTEMSAGKGYWIKMKIAANFSVLGSEPGKSVSLSSQWNLVGYNSTTPLLVADALASIDGKYLSVWAYTGPIDDPWRVYDPANPGFSDLTTMEPGYGYWINATEACTWTLP